MGAPGSNAFLRDDGTLAQVSGNRIPNHVTVQRLDDPEDEPRVVPGSEKTSQVLGWRDDRLLLTKEVLGLGQQEPQRAAVVAIDPTDGTSESLVEGGDDLLGWSWAADLLDAPVVRGVEPPSPLDPRAVLGTGAAVVVLTLGGLVLWRRRGHP